MDQFLDRECPDCNSRLRLDEGSPDSRTEPGTPRMVYCEVCGVDYPEILTQLDAAVFERARLHSLLYRSLTFMEAELPDVTVRRRPKILTDLRRELGKEP